MMSALQRANERIAMGRKRLYLGGLSALECWTAAAVGMAPWPRKTRISTFGDVSSTDADVRAHDPGSKGAVTLPYRILVPRRGSNLRSRQCMRKRMVEPFPAGSFFDCGNGVYIASPELCAIHFAERAPLWQTALLCCELLGRYAIDPRDRKLVVRAPLSSIASLSAYCKQANRTPGVKNASRAARLSVENSYSPMESKLALILSAPGAYGCFGLPKPVMNKEVAVRDGASGGKTTRKPDLLWEEHGIALEYESSEHHEGEASIDRDSRRRNGLVHQGFIVYTATAAQVFDQASMAALARTIALALRMRPVPRVADFSTRFARAHDEIMHGDDLSPRPAIPRAPLPLQ